MIAGVNSDMALLCSILLSFPEVILIVPDISAKDKSKDFLITILNQVLHKQFSNKGNFNADRRRNIRILNNKIS